MRQNSVGMIIEGLVRVDEAKSEMSKLITKWGKSKDGLLVSIGNYLKNDLKLNFVKESFYFDKPKIDGYYDYWFNAEATLSDKSCVVALKEDKETLEFFIWDGFKKQKSKSVIIDSLDTLKSLVTKHWKKIYSNGSKLEALVKRTIKNIPGLKAKKYELKESFHWEDSVGLENSGGGSVAEFKLEIQNSKGPLLAEGETYTLAEDVYWCDEEVADADYAENEESSEYMDALICRKYLELDSKKGPNGKPWIVLPKGLELKIVSCDSNGIVFNNSSLWEDIYISFHDIKDKSGKPLSAYKAFGLNKSAEEENVIESIVDYIGSKFPIYSKKDLERGRVYLTTSYNSGEMHFLIEPAFRGNSVFVYCAARGV